jgi:sugar phosphate permease
MSEFAKPAADTSAEPASRPTWVRWRILAILLAFSFMSWFNRISMSVAYDEQISRRYDISEPEIGFVYSAMLTAYAIFMTPGGWFADRHGPKLALVLMGFGSALFVALTGLPSLSVQSAVLILVWLLIVRSAMGVCTAPIYPASGRVIAHWIPFRQRAWANGMVMSAALIGIASTFYGFGFLLDRFDWPAAFAITGAMTAFLALIWAWYGRNNPSQHPAVNAAELEVIRFEEPVADEARDTTPAWRVLLGNRNLVLLTLSYAAVGYFEYLFYFWIPTYFKEALEFNKEKTRLYSTVVNLTMAIGMVLGGMLADFLSRIWGQRRGRAVVIVGGLLGAAAFSYAGVLTKQPMWSVTLFALATASIGATEGPFWATAIDLGGRRGGTSAGIFNTGGNAGGVMSPVLTPLVKTYLSWQSGIGLGGLICVIGAVLWLWIRPGQVSKGPSRL